MKFITKIFVIFTLIWCVCSIQHSSVQSDDNNDVFLGLNQNSGFIELDANSSMFYWLFRSESEDTNKPLIISLAGGPGCSSELSVFGGNGPYRVNSNLTLEKNDYSWIQVANVLFVDQPIGTGYSFTTVFDSTEQQYSEQFYQFFVGFLEKFPEFKKRPLYIAGVSYGGHFVPDIAYYMFEQNNTEINLIGLSIGDGWVNPYLQYASYPAYALQNDLINSSAAAQYQQQMKLCQQLIKNGKYEQSFNYCTQIESNILGNPQLFNEYNIKMPVSAYSFDGIQEFLQQPKIIKDLNVQNNTWTECSASVYNSLNVDFQLDVSDKIAYLLKNGIKVVSYNGEYDFICNWIGGLQWIKAMKWDYQTEFNQLNLSDWKNGDHVYGKIQQFGNLTFLKINNAGHMVPTDQPQVSLHQITSFINN